MGEICSAFLHDAVSIVSSYIFSKHEDRVSAGNNIERLEMAHSDLEHALERTGKLPVTDVSLLRRRKFLKRAFEECSDVLHRCKLQAHEDDETEEGRMVINSSFSKRIARATQSSIAYFFNMKQDGLCYSNVRRFERLADCAGKFVRDVESGCSIRQYTFCNPLIRKLLQGKTLRYEKVHKSRHRDIYLWPVCLEERGVEAILSYKYEDYKMPEKNFHLRLLLRLSESTDIVGTAIKCLQYLASQFKIVAETATGEVTLLHDVHDISHSYAPPWVGIEEFHNRLAQVCRPDPTCCKSNGHAISAENIANSELSQQIPEEVTVICFLCKLRSSTHEVSRNDLIDCSIPVRLNVGFAPHAVPGGLVRIDGTKDAAKGDRRDGNVEEEIEMVKSKTIDFLIRQPELVNYSTLWQYVHGSAFFQLLWEPPGSVHKPEDRSKTRRVTKRRLQEV